MNLIEIVLSFIYKTRITNQKTTHFLPMYLVSSIYFYFLLLLLKLNNFKSNM